MGNWVKTIGCWLVVLSSSALAMTPGQDDFLKAEKFLQKRQYGQFKLAFEKLHNHPLAPYLETRWLQTQFHKKPITEIDQFFKEYAEQPPAIQLRKRWLSYLARRQEWNLFLSYYQPTSNLSLQCQRVKALEQTKKQFDAIREGQEIWLMGVSLPKACDKLFAGWKRYGYLSQDLIYQRMINALPKRQHKLVRYLKRRMDSSYLAKAKVVEYFWRHPNMIFTQKNALEQTPQVRFMVLNKVLKKHPEFLLSYANHKVFNGLDQEQKQALRKTALHASALQSPSNIYEWYEIAQSNRLLSEELQQDFLQGAITSQNWPLYTHLFKLTDEPFKQEPKWQYWQGRALSSLGASLKQSRPFYETAALHRDYYGFMASQKLGVSASMNHAPTHVPASIMQRIKLEPGIKRALALFDLGRIVPARREFQAVFDQQNVDGKQALAILAARLEWPDRAIMSLAQIKSWHDLQLRFPLAHDHLFDLAAKKNNINKNWIYGIARQESAFMQDARSPVGATGLMQLMPSTARTISRRMRVAYSSKRLTDPSYNIQLGSHYLHSLLKRFDGNRILATAAYNAGPGNVKRWLKKNTGPLDIWIEQIPFNETKEYVQRVLTYSTIYSYRLGYLQPILDDSTISAWAQLQPEELKISDANMKQNDKG
ncbi:MAG: transglycosylase SLT domain-containing protein [Gammaproteobacteria bacterium]|nr:transglycosylase SLT domain-containing protein [Gammaproteobacteria bacterium]